MDDAEGACGGMKSTGVAMLGYGFAATFHAENHKRVHGIDVRLTGVWGRRPDADSEFASAHSTPRKIPAYCEQGSRSALRRRAQGA